MIIRKEQDIERILLDERQLNAITDRISAEIRATYAGSPCTLLAVCVLKGAVVFYTDLVRKLRLPVELDFIKASSYFSGTSSTGALNISLDLRRNDYENLDILLIEDIADSGRTLSALTDELRRRGAHSVRTVVLLDKPSRREVDFAADMVGATIPDEFVVGYGLDYNERYRALPYIGVLDPRVYR